jgi:hypothetical protein
MTSSIKSNHLSKPKEWQSANEKGIQMKDVFSKKALVVLSLLVLLTVLGAKPVEQPNSTVARVAELEAKVATLEFEMMMVINVVSQIDPCWDVGGCP